MIINIPKSLLKDFKHQWDDCLQNYIELAELNEITFVCEGLILNKDFKPTKSKAPKELFVLNITKDSFIPSQLGAFDLRAEIKMLSDSVLNGLDNKTYAKQLYALYNPNFEPISLTFPELRFLWNYIQAYVSICFVQEGHDFTVDSIKDQFLMGLSTISKAKPIKVGDLDNMPPSFIPSAFNNYQTWYNNSEYGVRWKDFVENMRKK